MPLDNVAPRRTGKAVKTVRENYVKRLRDNYLLILRTLMHDLIVSIDKDGNFVFVNDDAVEFWGKSSKKIIGTHFTEYLHPEDIKKTITALQDLIENKMEQRNLPNHHKTQKRFRESKVRLLTELNIPIHNTVYDICSLRLGCIDHRHSSRSINGVHVTSSTCYGYIHADSNNIQFLSRTDGQRRHETHCAFSIIRGWLQRTAELHQNQEPLRYTLKKRDAVGITKANRNRKENCLESSFSSRYCDQTIPCLC